MNKFCSRIALSLVLAVLSFGTLSAQDESVKQLTKDKPMMGLKLGLNVANYGESDFSPRPCVGAGVMFDIPLKRNWVVMPGVMFEMKGARTSRSRFWYSVVDRYGKTTDYTSDEKFFISPLYVDIPVMFGYKYKIDHYSQLYWAAGPYVSFAVGGKLKKEFTGDTDKIGFYEKESEIYDFGYNRVSGGLDFEFGYCYDGWKFSVGYDLGLTPISSKDQYEPELWQGSKQLADRIPLTRDYMKHRVWKISLAYYFNL